MKSLKIPFLFFAVATILILFTQSSEKPPIDWSDGFGAGQTKPFGSYILYESLDEIFAVDDVVEIDETFYEMELDGKLPQQGSIIIVTDKLALDQLETDALLEWVDGGGHLLVATRSITGHFADSLGLQMQGGAAQVWMVDGPGGLARDSLAFVSPYFGTDRHFEVRSRRRLSFLSIFDEDLAIVVEQIAERPQMSQEDLAGIVEDLDAADLEEVDLGEVDEETEFEEADVVEDIGVEQQVATIRMPIGSGEIVLTSVPEGFANVVMMTDDGRRRATRLLSYLPTGPVYWNSYYKPAGSEGRDRPVFSYIQSRPLLYQAWLLFLFGIGAYLIFSLRRRQRIIPVVTPPKNVTLDFVETIGRLYHDRGTPAGIAEKRITSLLEYIRTRLNLATTSFDDLFARRLAERSGIPHEKIVPLVAAMKTKGATMSEGELLRLNRMIEDFYEETRR